jgi:Ni/Co efflux regulator RcnB
MKRFLMAIAAVACVAGPIAAAASPALAGDGRGQSERNHDRGDQRRDHRMDQRHDNRVDHRNDHRDDRRWDRARHNGYYYRNRWHYGSPPSAYYRNPYYRPGYHAWRRGAYLPPSYRGRGYVVYDYGRYRLRHPPRGYYWYRSGSDFILAAIATGLIYEVVNN